MCIICQMKTTLAKHNVSDEAINEITGPFNELLVKVNAMLDALHTFHETLPEGLDANTMIAVRAVEAYFAPPQEPSMLEALIAEMEAIGIPVRVIRTEGDAEQLAKEWTKDLNQPDNLANWTPPQDKKAN